MLWCSLILPKGVSSISAPQSATDDGRAFRAEDNFEYRLLDFGFGVIRSKDRYSAKEKASERALWFKFKLTNISDRLLGVPQKMSELEPLAATDDAGNELLVRNLTYLVMGESPMPLARPQRFRPGESCLDVRVIAGREVIENVREVRIYFESRSDRLFGIRNPRLRWHFSIANPTQRRRDFSADLVDPPPTELTAKVEMEKLPPAIKRP